MGWVNWLLFVIAQVFALASWLIGIASIIGVSDGDDVEPPVAWVLMIGAFLATALDVVSFVPSASVAKYLIQHRGWPPERSTDVKVILAALATWFVAVMVNEWADDGWRVLAGILACCLVGLCVLVFLNASWLPERALIADPSSRQTPVVAISPSPKPSPTPAVSVPATSPTPSATPARSPSVSPSPSPSPTVIYVTEGTTTPFGVVGVWITFVALVIGAITGVALLFKRR